MPIETLLITETVISQLTSNMKIERALRSDAAALTALALRSKDYWGYGAQLIDSWRDELSLSPKYIHENEVYKLTIEDTILGFYAFCNQDAATIKLNFLFVEPSSIGKGYGQQLLQHFFAEIQKTTCQKVTVDADPNAQIFYERNGFTVVDKLESSIKNRYLPVMEINL